MTSGAYLHKASYVVPVSGGNDSPAVICDGAVLTRNGRIVEVAPASDLKAADAVEVDHGRAVLMPALVNCHSHLELSHLAYLARRTERYEGNMPAWIGELLEEREKLCDPDDVRLESQMALARLYAGGCRGLLDIGNLPESREISDGFKVDCRFHQEILGLTEAGTEAGIALLDSVADDPSLFFTGHAPYSTAPKLIRVLKERADRFGHLFPIHLAESPAETEFLHSGTGPFRDFIEERKVWDGSFEIPGKSPVAYLDGLGVFDEKTLCVHCVQCGEDDLDIIAKRSAKVCLCPGSNRFLGVGTAQVMSMFDRGIKLVLGTDSMASNPQLSLWHEMSVLHEDHPGLAPIEIVRMATGNGAELMGIDAEIGTLAPGSSSSFLAVSGEMPETGNGEEILEWLVSAGLSIVTEWVE